MMNHYKQPARFNVEEWLKSIDIWDEKYDYVMHNSHWLTSKWEPDCEQCKASCSKRPTQENKSSPPPQTQTQTQSTPAPPTIATSQSNRLSMNSTFNDPTLKNDQTTHHHNNMDLSPPPAGPPPVTIAMTPIAPADMSRRNFVTPYTNSKLSVMAGNETFQRSTRQMTRQLANQTANQDLIDLNETFDLYRSALADTPQLAHHQTPGRNNDHHNNHHQNQHDQNIQQQQQQQQNQQQQQQQQQQHQQHQQQQQQPGGISSRIPKIPVRLSSAFGYGSHH